MGPACACEVGHVRHPHYKKSQIPTLESVIKSSENQGHEQIERESDIRPIPKRLPRKIEVCCPPSLRDGEVS